MDRDGHVIPFPAKLKALVFMFMKNTVVSIKDHTLQYHAVSFRVVHERIDNITDGGLSVNTVKMNVQLYRMAWSSEFPVQFGYSRAVCHLPVNLMRNLSNISPPHDTWLCLGTH